MFMASPFETDLFGQPSNKGTMKGAANQQPRKPELAAFLEEFCGGKKTMTMTSTSSLTRASKNNNIHTTESPGC